ncbi:hypothetical protein CEXT_642201 [Caerostris extrusa]|uniref:Uncharacterized protein n=1 Tax=Caerostris extrusa TaxID=172846 RepID=A0AAV4WCC3_CAEEX|nr:hypothetical protein CEXT_642201 [Caerostris extrusa]
METEDFIPLGRSAIVAAFPFKRGGTFIGPPLLSAWKACTPLRANNSRRKGVENTFTCLLFEFCIPTRTPNTVLYGVVGDTMWGDLDIVQCFML